MPDPAASVLAKLKTKQPRVAEAISFACSYFARRSFSVGLKGPNMLKTLCSRVDCSSIC